MACNRCGGCCQVAYVFRTSARTKENADYEEFLQFTRPQTFACFSDGLVIKAVCEHLTDDRKCRAYENRPKVCREFLCRKAMTGESNGVQPEQPGCTPLTLGRLEKNVSITLAEVFLSREARAKLLGSRLSPGLAYQLARYARTVDPEDKTVEEQRNALIQRHGKESGPGTWSVEQDSPEYPQFAAEFEELMGQDTKLEACKLKLSQVMEALEKHNENTLSAVECLALEPFFAPEDPPKEDA